MKKEYTKRLFLAVIFATTIFASLIVLNRWLVTDIGVLSYGRIWQLYISYGDFGFVRRALVGTFFSVTGLNSILVNEYHFAILMHSFAIIILSAIVFNYILRNNISDIPTVATVALSPAFIIQSGYTTGSLDIFVLIFAAINILYARNFLLFSSIIILGTLIHELFIFTIPAQLASYFVVLKGGGERYFGASTIVPIASIITSVTIIAFFGTADFSQEFVEAIMAEKIPNAAGQHSLWSGYFEISKAAPEYSMVSIGALLRNIEHAIIFLSLPLIYMVLVTARLVSYASNIIEKLAFAVSTVFPLLAALVATDLYRWIGMSANAGLLLTLLIIAGKKNTKSNLTFILLPFSLLAPFGSAQIDWPFPAHQFIMEKLFL